MINNIDIENGLKGLYNRIGMLANIQPYEVVDVVLFVPNNIPFCFNSMNKIMLLERTKSLMESGQDTTISSLYSTLCNEMGFVMTKKDYEKIQRQFQPEFNIGTNKIREGYRKVANTVMLMSRACHHIQTGHDMTFQYYIEMLKANGGNKI